VQIMSFLDMLNKRVKDIRVSAQKTSELTRIRRRVNTMSQEAEKLYAQVGKSYFAQFKGGGSKQDALDQMCSLIVTLERDISALVRQSDKLRQVNRCPKCGSAQNNENRFCAECGSKLAVEEPVIEEKVIEEKVIEEKVIKEPVKEEPAADPEPAGAPDIIGEPPAENAEPAVTEGAETAPKPKRPRAKPQNIEP
jgi:DNA-directed RNA polymerase subunit M/transcription elongation factor TFIIS